MSDHSPDVSSTERSPDGAVSGPDASEDGTGAGATCQNCGASLAGEYCHDCGQRHVPQLRVRDLGRRFLETVLDIEDLGKGLRNTLIDGVRSPGRLPRQYVDGKRKRLVNPIGFFLIASTLGYLVLSAFQAEWVQAQAEMYRAQWAAMGLSPSEVFSQQSLLRTELGWTSAEDVARGFFCGGETGSDVF